MQFSHEMHEIRTYHLDDFFLLYGMPVYPYIPSPSSVYDFEQFIQCTFSVN